MSTVIPLPERPNLEQLKKQAREASKSFGIKLSEAQFRIAQGYGFTSWPKLRQHVELVTALTREPEGEDFLALACLTYGEDSPARIERAVAMLADDPSLRTRDVWHAAACAAFDAVRGDLTAHGGPFAWEPLMYLCYSRIPADEASVLATATALLDGGADPNVGYLWHGLPTPFTALTGVLGGGEDNQPKHPHWRALAKLLLERGANPNDTQGLYNRQFTDETEHLELLLDFGLGQGDGGVWKQRMGAQIESPTEAVQHQLRWAIHHNMLERVRLFCERGVDITTPFDQVPLWAQHSAGRTPAEWAALNGHTEIVNVLVAHGAAPPVFDEVDRVIAAIMRGEEPDGDIEGARAARPSLVVQATAAMRGQAVKLAVEHGWDVNALGRADAPCEQPWQTALHTAVERDSFDAVRLLLALGADKSIVDARFNATPRGWAEHFDRPALASLLA